MPIYMCIEKDMRIHMCIEKELKYFCAEILARITILVYRESLGLSCSEGRHAIQVAISKCDILFASMR